jgi:protein ImuB
MFAAVFIPRISLQAILRQEPELLGRPVALLDDALPPAVTEMSSEAEVHGVRRGMTSAQALGRCFELVFRIPPASLRASARDILLQCTGSFSPWVEATDEGLATAEWRAWNGAQRIDQLQTALEQAVQRLGELGFIAQAGAATNPDLAALAARCAQPVLVMESEPAKFLMHLPMEVLLENEAGMSELRRKEQAHAFQVLRRWGLRQVGQVAVLQRAQLVERLGPEAELIWERANGRAQRLLKLVRVPEHFVEMHEFEHEVETLEPLLFILRRFVEQLSARLEMMHRVAASLRLRLKFDRNEPHERELKVPSPTGDVEVLFRMLSTHLEQLTAESPIVKVELEAIATPQQRSQFDLFSSRLRDPNQFYETLARLEALLGAERVGSPVLIDSHRPDAFRIEVPHFDAQMDYTAGAGEELALGLPLQRFRPPVETQVEMHDGLPDYVRSPIVNGKVKAVRGPWLNSGEWWTAEAWERVEWDVQLGPGIYRLVQEPGSSALEGRYE